jgi:hypothetical protein
VAGAWFACSHAPLQSGVDLVVGNAAFSSTARRFPALAGERPAVEVSVTEAVPSDRVRREAPSSLEFLLRRR